MAHGDARPRLSMIYVVGAQTFPSSLQSHPIPELALLDQTHIYLCELVRRSMRFAFASINEIKNAVTGDIYACLGDIDDKVWVDTKVIFLPRLAINVIFAHAEPMFMYVRTCLRASRIL